MLVWSVTADSLSLGIWDEVPSLRKNPRKTIRRRIARLHGFRWLAHSNRKHRSNRKRYFHGEELDVASLLGSVGGASTDAMSEGTTGEKSEDSNWPARPTSQVL